MASASEQISAPVKKTRAKAPERTCGVPNCHLVVAAGAKLRLTVLESAALYPGANEGKLSTCKPHRKCVGFEGYSPEIARGTEIFQACGDPAKVFYLGRSFCESCHNVYLEALVAQCKPRLSAEQVDVVRRQVVQDNFKKPEPADSDTAEIAELLAKVKAIEAKKAPKKASAKKAAAAAPAPVAVVTAPAKPAPKVSKAKAPPTESVSADEEETVGSGSETETMEVEPAVKVTRPVQPEPTPVVEPMKIPVLDEFEELDKQSKEERALAAVTQAVPAEPAPAPIVVKAAAVKPKKAAPVVVKA